MIRRIRWRPWRLQCFATDPDPVWVGEWQVRITPHEIRQIAVYVTPSGVTALGPRLFRWAKRDTWKTLRANLSAEGFS